MSRGGKDCNKLRPFSKCVHSPFCIMCLRLYRDKIGQKKRLKESIFSESL